MADHNRSAPSGERNDGASSLSSLRRRPIQEPPRRLVFEPFVSKEYRGKVPGDEQDRVGADHNEDCGIECIGTVYVLHGWAQNVHVVSNRARKLTKRLNKAGYRVIFLQAPHRLPPIANEEDDDSSNLPLFSREYAYAWFFYGDDDSKETAREPRPSKTGSFRGMKESLEYLRSAIRATHDSNTPVFLLGFSQGAVLVHKIATLACDTECDDGWNKIRKCILVSGFSFRDNDNDNESYCTATTTMPSFHVVGTRDHRVAPRLTMEVYSQEPCFRHPQTILWEHDRGHVLPQDQAFCARVISFLKE